MKRCTIVALLSFLSSLMAHGQFTCLLPEVQFMEHSTEAVNDSAYWTMIGEAVQVMSANPSIDTLALDSHSDAQEHDPEGLSNARGEKVKADIVRGGVDSGRVDVRPQGASSPRITPRQIDLMTTSEEMEAARRHNRRVEFRVVSFRR